MSRFAGRSPLGRLGLAAVLSLVAAAASLAVAQPAYAADITVTITTDTVAADADTSLREAITAANAAGSDTIELVAGETYQLDLCAGVADEDANASGDLDYTDDEPLTINGNGATIEQTCAGQRVLHQTDTSAAVTVNNVTLTGGSGVGAAVHFAGDLELTGVTATDNDAGVDRVVAGMNVLPGPSLVLTSSNISDNIGTGVYLSNGPVTITDSTVSDNSGSGVDLTDGALTITDSRFEDNGSNGVRTTGQGSGLLTFANSVTSDNGGTGLICSACGDVQMTGSSASGNDAGGVQVSVDQDAPTDEVSITVETSSITGNTKTGPGAGLAVTIAELDMDPPPAQILLNRSTVSGNAATGGTGDGGGVWAETGEVRVNNSTMTGNTASVAGGAVLTETGDVFLQHATVVENTAPVGANISSGAGLEAFGSIVADGGGAGSDCDLAGAVTTAGYNVGGDASCGFSGTGDVQNAGDPLLGPLQDNGGPTLTMVPLAGSPALGRIPVAACTVFAVDQRGTARPQGGSCESGAVEVAPAGGGNGLPPTGIQITGFLLAGFVLVLLGAALVVAVRRRSRPTAN